MASMKRPVSLQAKGRTSAVSTARFLLGLLPTASWVACRKACQSIGVLCPVSNGTRARQVEP